MLMSPLSLHMFALWDGVSVWVYDLAVVFLLWLEESLSFLPVLLKDFCIIGV